MLTCDNKSLCDINTTSQSVNSHTPQIIPDDKTLPETTRCDRKINMPEYFKD